MNSSIAPLKINQLSRLYGDFKAVDQVSFDIQPGEIFGLLGPNGAGKTTIISTIVTLQRPSEGSVEVFGHDVVKDPIGAKKRVGFVPQELVNHGFFSAFEILQFHSGYYGIWPNNERIERLMKSLSLWEHREKIVRQLSGGMRRRLMIAKALVHSPRLLLLDEPTAGVDSELRQNLWNFVQELRNEGVSVLLTTHYLEEAQQMCDRVGILNRGQLREVGKTSELIRELTTTEVSFHLPKAFETTSPYLTSKENEVYTFKIPGQMQVTDLLRDLNLDFRELKNLRIKEGRLEDAFLSVVRKQ